MKTIGNIGNAAILIFNPKRNKVKEGYPQFNLELDCPAFKI
jgi:hypothetical protein